MRMLITGGTGFIGSYLVKLLCKNKHELLLVAGPNSDFWRIGACLDKIKVLTCDYFSIENLEQEIFKFKPEVLFHLGWSGVANNSRNDFAQVTSNLKSTFDLLSICHKADCKRWVILGSQAEYGPLNRIAKEEDLTSPTTLYGTVKLSVQLIASQLSKLCNSKLVWVRVFSTYGPMDHEYWMLPSVINQLLNKKIPKLTLGEQLWDYLYVEDAVEAIYQLGINQKAEGVFNLGSGKVQSIKNIVEMISVYIDKNIKLKFGEVPYREDQVMHLQADITKIKSTINWYPKTKLEYGIKKTVDWYRGKLNAN
ncbi:MAG: NAD(P)-dependent oxidoreductase [Deltaproteobacteria bacterium]|nr:NAD(P)-dependent oxidoreductase [Deltaproteobacteria bacterium]